MAAPSSATFSSLGSWRRDSIRTRSSPPASIRASLPPASLSMNGLAELGWRLAKPFMLSPEKGAETPVFIAIVPDPKPFHGGYVIRKALAQPDPTALDSGLARRLWDESARLAGL